MKGRTRWYPIGIKPIRNGEYECHVRLPGGLQTVWRLEWDSIGFLVPITMVVYRWRGLTKQGAKNAHSH